MRSDRFLIDKKHLQDIAESIRNKLGTDTQYRPAEMAEAIDQIDVSDPTLITKEITANGTYSAEADNADGYSSVTVDVPDPPGPTLITKQITANGTYSAEDDNADGYSSVTVTVPEGVTVLSGAGYPADDIGNDGNLYLLIASETQQLPDGYTGIGGLVIGSSGGAWIMTDYNFTATTEYEICAKWMATPNSNSWLFGAYVSGKQSTFGYTDGKVWLQAGGSYVKFTLDTNVHIWKAASDAFYYDGIEQTGSTPNWSNTTTNTVRLFYIGAGTYSNNCVLYYAKIWDNGTLVRHFVPAMRDSDSALGVYDLVNDMFYENSGSGSFDIGGANTEILNAYVKVNGSWQELIGSDITDVGVII